jgi:antitoxin StbD
MTILNLSIRELMNSIVPITRFNRGEASKIFEEVNEAGVKVVFKNNSPVSVLVDPKRYEEMIEALEDYALFIEAEKRMKNAQGEKSLSNDQVMKTLGLNEHDLDEVDVEIES